jgi:serine/threonine protein kinase
MALGAGDRVGVYDIVRHVGAGGMGDVYEGRDVRLGRPVAIKVVRGIGPTPESRARLAREAKAISRLQHPHICTLYDIGTHDDQDYLVLEYLEGETLATRLERGRIPLAEALSITHQIASALDAAHRQGLVHRDLKPGNIMLVRGSSLNVKLLDFGLAKDVAPAVRPDDATTQGMSDVRQPATAQGALLGTFGYMAPEQIEGQTVDARADLWALGCVIYEMVSGSPPFQGRTPASIMSATLKDEPPPLSSKQPLAPAALDHIVRVCLAKNPDARFSTAHDVAIALSLVSHSTTPSAASERPPRRSRLMWIGLATALALVLVGAGSYIVGTRRSEPPGPSWLELAPIDDLNLSTVPAVSPDGRNIVYVAAGRLWLRTLDRPAATALPGTEWAEFPFWAPDGESIAFGSSTGHLMRIDLRPDIGAPVRVCPAEQFRGGAWLADDTLLFATVWGPIQKVPASGGTPVALTTLDGTLGERSHRFPTALPDGRFLYLSYAAESSESALWMASVRNPTDRRLVVQATSGGGYAADHLFYVSNSSLVARRFDPRAGELTGRQLVIADRLTQPNTLGAEPFSVSPAGTLAFSQPRTVLRQLEVVTRQGLVSRRIRAEEATVSVDLSPEGDRAVVVRNSRKAALIDLANEFERPLVESADSREAWPLWSPDGKSIFLSIPSGQGGNFNLYSVPATGGMPVPAAARAPTRMTAAGVGADGALYWSGFTATGGGGDFFRQPAGSSTPEVFFSSTNVGEVFGRVSPDGKWIVYAAVTSRDIQILVRSLVDKNVWAPVSVSGGQYPRWRKDGAEIYFVSVDGWLMAAPVRTSPALTVGRPERLFSLDITDCDGPCYDVFADGRFLVGRLTTRGPAKLTVVQHWRDPR